MALQEELIAGFSKVRFQQKLHAAWRAAGDDNFKQLQARQNVCLPVQIPVVAKFGFEASRKGVALSVNAYSAVELAADPEIAKRNHMLKVLVTPPMQTEPPPPLPAEEEFLMRFGLEPPGGFRDSAVDEEGAAGARGGGASPARTSAGTEAKARLTPEQAKAMQDELITEYSAEAFQKKLHEAYWAAWGDQAKIAKAQQKARLEVQIPIVAKYGFEPSFEGVLKSLEAFTPEINAHPDIAYGSEYIMWLLDPGWQAAAPKAFASKREAEFHIWCQDGRLACSISMDVSGTVRGLKEALASGGEIGLHSIQLFFGTSELINWELLSGIAEAGSSADLQLRTRRPEVAYWLGRLQDEVAATKGRRSEMFYSTKAPACLEEIPAELLADVDFVLALVQVGGQYLSAAAPELRADREVVLAAVRQMGAALQHAAPELRADREIVLAAVSEDPWALDFASPELKADREVVLLAVQQDEWALNFAAPELLGDREIVLTVVEGNGSILKIITPELKNDRDVVLLAVRERGATLEFAGPAPRADREVALTAVKQDGWALEYVDPTLQADRDVVLEAVRRAGRALKFASQALREDRTVILTAVRRDGMALLLVRPELQDFEIALAAVESDASALNFVRKNLFDEVLEAHCENRGHARPQWIPRRDGKYEPPPEDPRVLHPLQALKRHFEVLGIPEDTPKEEIPRHYRRLARKHHPDKHPEDQDGAKRRFQAINNAFHALKSILKID